MKVADQPCRICRQIWTGSRECRECTGEVIKEMEGQVMARMFADFRPRGSNPPEFI